MITLELLKFMSVAGGLILGVIATAEFVKIAKYVTNSKRKFDGEYTVSIHRKKIR